jgi:hypothetical protein
MDAANTRRVLRVDNEPVAMPCAPCASICVKSAGPHGVLPAVIVTGDTAALRLRTFCGLAATVMRKPIDGARLSRALTEAFEAGAGEDD